MGNCIFYPCIKLENTNDKNLKCEDSQIKKYDFFAINEIDISKKISKISNFYSRFQPIINHSMVSLAEVDKRYDIIKRNGNEQYVLLFYENINNNNKMIFLQDYLLKKNLKRQILDMINSYKYLLKSLEILWTDKIVHYNLNFNNIFFNMTDSPIIRNFTQSFHINNLNEERKRKIFQYYYPENYFYPLETHIICFLNNSSNSLSMFNIEKICNDFININLKSLHIFSDDFLEKYKKIAIFSLKSYINKPNEEVINDIIQKNCFNWDNYSLSIIYLILLKNIFGNNGNSFILRFSQLLLRNIDINPLNRYNIQKTAEEFENILNDCDFDYVNI